MKIYAISLIKNESDIIAQNLIAASKWADKIFVFDNGSTDGTWDIVKGLASQKIIPYKSLDLPYRDSLRQQVFESFRDELSNGDWICLKLDADEFYWDDPRVFLSKQSGYVSLIKGLAIEFQYTEDNKEQDKNIFNPDDFEYCFIENFEERFFKYRKGLVWSCDNSLPTHPGVTGKHMIRFAHYQFRSKNQILKRLKVRKQAISSGYSMYWERDLEAGWEDKIFDKKRLIKVKNLSEADSIIQTLNIKNNEGFLRRFIKRIMHGFKLWP